MSRPVVLVVEHEADSGAAMLGERFEALGFELEVRNPERQGLPVSAEPYAALLVMGASPSVNDEHIRPWFESEVALLQDADRSEVPVFGVCFGAQALAVALGGSVTRASEPEIGWFTVDTIDDHLVPSGPWFEWHVDTITPPAAANVIAHTPVSVQAYTLGRHLAVQFHPEVTDAQARDWSVGDAETIARLGISRDALIDQSVAELPAARERANALVDRFLEHARIAAPIGSTQSVAG